MGQQIDFDLSKCPAQSVGTLDVIFGLWDQGGSVRLGLFEDAPDGGYMYLGGSALTGMLWMFPPTALGGTELDWPDGTKEFLTFQQAWDKYGSDLVLKFVDKANAMLAARFQTAGVSPVVVTATDAKSGVLATLALLKFSNGRLVRK